LSSHVVQHELLFTFINDDNAGEMRLTTKTRCEKFKLWRFEFERNRVILLAKKFFVCRSVDRPDSEVATQSTRCWCVEIENPCVATSNTAANGTKSCRYDELH
jgi:hypothetical protein